MESARMTAFHEVTGVGDWRLLGPDAYAWFAAGAHRDGAELVSRIADLAGSTGLPDVDLRPDGIRVRIVASDAEGSAEAGPAIARAISEAASDLGLVADPSVLQEMGLIIDAADPATVRPFWQTALAYEDLGDGPIADPLRRDPGVAFHQDQPRPLRDRIHVDIGRPSEAVKAVQSAVESDPHGPYGVRLADSDGNEIDLLPGDAIPGDHDAADWRVLFSAMTFYPTTSSATASRFANTVAGLADDAGLPLLIDLRPDGVMIDSGKDQWEDDQRADAARFVDLGAQVQAAAHDMGLSADPTRLRFLQLGIDAVDVPSVRAFWTTVLGYRHDPPPSVTDIYDPRRLNPVIMFQQMDASDVDRLQQRNRLHLELVVPRGHFQARVETAVGAGGRILTGETPGRCTLADPEGNELDIVTDHAT